MNFLSLVYSAFMDGRKNAWFQHNYVKLTIFIVPLFCIMVQPYLLFSINTSLRTITEEKVKQSITTRSFLHGSQSLYPLLVWMRKTKADENLSSLSLQMAIKYTKITWFCIILTRKNTKIHGFPDFWENFTHAQTAETRHSFCLS